MINIRVAEPDDAPEMARVIVDTWFAAHEGQVPVEKFRQRREQWGYAESEQGWRRILGEGRDGSSQAWVATSDGRVIAVAAGEILGGGVAEVGALYVDVPYQRSGTGRRLITAVIDHYRGVAISKLDIAVLAANQPARTFYERLGGREAGTREDPEGLEIIYSWDLDAE